MKANGTVALVSIRETAVDTWPGVIYHVIEKSKEEDHARPEEQQDADGSFCIQSQQDVEPIVLQQTAQGMPVVAVPNADLVSGLMVGQIAFNQAGKLRFQGDGGHAIEPAKGHPQIAKAVAETKVGGEAP